MLDLIYLLATLGFFFGSIVYAWWCGKIDLNHTHPPSSFMGTTILGVIAVLLLIYLFATMIYPEKF